MPKRPSSALEAEALGLDFIEVTFQGHAFRVPLDVDSWPLDGVRECLGFNVAEKAIVPRHSMIAAILERLLGPVQWVQFREAAPKRRHWIPASHAFATAAGFPPRPEYADRAFGALPWLLAILDEWPEMAESDLDRFWGLAYGDRYVLDAGGRRLLTLRKIHARLSTLPVDSALAIAMNGGKLHRSGTELVLMDLYQRLTGERHPSRPMDPAAAAAADLEAKQLAAAKAQHQERQAKRTARQSTGVDNARANARREMRKGAHAQDK